MKKYELSIVIKEVDGQESKDLFREFSVADNMHKVIYRVLTITNYLCEQVAAGLMLKYHKEAWGNTLPPSQLHAQVQRTSDISKGEKP